MLLCEKVSVLVSSSSYLNTVPVPAVLFPSAPTGAIEILNSNTFIGDEYKYKYISNNCNDYYVNVQINSSQTVQVWMR